jgi:hypothetical protein
MLQQYRSNQDLPRSLALAPVEPIAANEFPDRPSFEILFRGSFWRMLSYLLWGLPLGVLVGCQPTPRQAIIEGASMAPHLYGAHTQLACADCGFQASLLLDSSLKNLLCPNCGASNSSARLRKQPAPLMVVEELQEQPRRWEIVAFNAPYSRQDSPRLTVKRIVGLPGEELKIAEGDLWIDGRRLAKRWEEQRELAVLIRDFEFLPRSEAGGTISPWFSTANHNLWNSDNGPVPTPTRLEYRHWAGYQSGQPRFQPVPILDAQPFDPREARTLLPVYDLLLTCAVATPEKRFGFGFQQFEPPISCEVCPDLGKLRVRQTADQTVQEFTYTPPITPYQFGISTCDRQLTIAIDDRQLLQIPITSSPQPDRQQLSRPLFLESADGPIRLSHIQLLRDVYYLERASGEPASPRDKQYKLGAREYLVLGDNPQDSIDSRDWPQPGLSRSQMIGRVGKVGRQ